MNETFQSVIAYRMNSVEERMRILEDVIRNISKTVSELRQDMKDWKVSPCIGEIVRTEAPEPVDPDILETITMRSPSVVKKRWAEWKRLTLQGKTPSQISRMYKCHHTAVTNAIARNFEPAWLKKGKRT